MKHLFSSAALLLAFLVLAFAPHATAQNLITNGSCEPQAADPANAPSDWTAVGAQPANDYDCDEYSGFGGPSAQDGTNYFAPSQPSFPTAAEIRQDVDVTAFAAGIATGTQKFDFEGHFNTFDATTGDRMQVILEYLDGASTVLGSFNSGLVSNGDHPNWTPLTQQVTVPAGTETVRVRLICNRTSGSFCDAYADDLSLEDAGSDPVGVSVDDVTHDEGDGAAVFTISLSSPASGDVTVDYTTMEVSAATVLDYTPTAGTAIITNGTSSTTVNVPLIDDVLGELDETFEFVLSNPSAGVALADAQGIGTIQDNDGGFVDNLIANASCEPQSIDPAAAPTDWTQVGTQDWDCDDYSGFGAPGPDDGLAYFAVSTTTVGNGDTEELAQTIDLSPFAIPIAAGNQRFNLFGAINQFSGSNDRARVEVSFLDEFDQFVGVPYDSGALAGDGTTSGWGQVATLIDVPTSAKSLRISVLCENTTGSTCDAYVDDLVLYSVLPAPICPAPFIADKRVEANATPPYLEIDLDAGGPGTTLTDVKFVDTDGTTRLLNGLNASLVSGDLTAVTGDYIWEDTAPGSQFATFKLESDGSPNFAYFVELTNSCGQVSYVDPQNSFTAFTNLEDAAGLPTEYALDGNYPNPFNPQTTVRYALPEMASVRLVVYDVMGRQVQVLIDGTQPAGWHEATFDAADLPSGAYLYRLEAGSYTEIRTMLLVK